MNQSRNVLRMWSMVVCIIVCLATTIGAQTIEKIVIPQDAPFLPGATPPHHVASLPDA